MSNSGENKFLEVSSFEDDPEKAEGIVEVLPFSKANKFLVKKSYCYVPFSECEESESYNIDLGEGFKVSKLSTTENSEILKHYKGISGDYHLIETEEGFWFLSEKGEVFPSLQKTFAVKGWNYKDNCYISYNVLSNLDRLKYGTGKALKQVLISYKLSYLLETSLYRIKNNILLTSESLKDLDLYDLLILKNMVFAKYNYAFDNQYYQAFFNLYKFYNQKFRRDNRTKDVTSLLSDIDLKNLREINKALDKFNR